MSRLPNPGGDNGNWGDILNDYLSQSHKSDGTIKDDAVTANTIAPNAVNATTIADGSVTETLLNTSVQTKLNARLPTGAPPAGMYGIPCTSMGSTDSLAVSNGLSQYTPNVVTYVAITILWPVTLTGWTSSVITQSSLNIRLGLYATDISGNPTTVLWDSGAIAVANTGAQSGSLSNIFLPVGKYLAAVNCDSPLCLANPYPSDAQFMTRHPLVNVLLVPAGMTKPQSFGAYANNPAAPSPGGVGMFPYLLQWTE